MFKTFKVFYSPGEVGGTGTTQPAGDDSSGITDRDILNGDDDGVSDEEVPDGRRKSGKREEREESLSEDEDEELSSEDEEGEEESEEESDDDEESDGTGDEDLEEDEEEVEELALSDLTKAVKKAAPDLFKKVPGLREALERDKKFGEVFATPEDAAQAARNSGYLAAVYSDIASGDVERTGNFLKAIKNTNEVAFEDFSHTILDSIGKIDPNMYGEIMLKPMKRALMAMYADGLKTNNKNLAAVAIHAHNYWFDTQDIKAPLEDRKKVTKTKEQAAWEREKEEYEGTRVNEFRGAITEVVNHSMKLSITKELDGLKLDEYQKRNIIRDIFLGVDEILGSDKRYLGGINSLFDQARSSKYSPDWKSRIVKAYLQRARQALPAIRNKVLREAGIKHKDQPKSESRRLVPAGLGGNKSEGTGIDFSRVDRSRTTDMDILNGKPKYLK
jgi:hypothetical protein